MIINDAIAELSGTVVTALDNLDTLLMDLEHKDGKWVLDGEELSLAAKRKLNRAINNAEQFVDDMRSARGFE